MENIKSSRLDFRDFAYEDAFEESQYFESLQKELNKKAVLILAAGDNGHLNNAVKAARFLAKKRFNVFVDFPLEKINGKTKRIFEVKKNSKEYFDALATSKYIITQKILPLDYIKRNEQVVINDTVLKGSTLEKRKARNLNNKKSDYLVLNEFRKSGITFDEMLRQLYKGKLKEKPAKKTKEEVLFAVDLVSSDIGLDYFFRFINQIDLEKTNVSLLIDHAFFSQYCQKLSKLDKRINVYTKKGKYLRNKEDNKKIAFLNRELGHMESFSEIEDFIPSYIFEWEKKRLFGKARFDTVVNIGFDHFYWIWLAKKLADKKLISVNQNYMLITNAENAKAKVNVMSLADEVYYPTYENPVVTPSFTEALENSSKLLSFIPLNTVEQQELRKFTLKHGAKLITNIAPNGIFDSFKLQSVPYFDEKGADCIFADNTVSAANMMSFIKAVAKINGKPIIVIDIFMHLYNANIEELTSSDNIAYITSTDVYSPLLPRLDKCYLIKENAGIQFEAEKHGIIPVLYDAENDKEISLSPADYSFDMEL